tara:strand:- start:78 stop:203 length:126 start_codon:yes stop_codon:yes gene_type:complete
MQIDDIIKNLIEDWLIEDVKDDIDLYMEEKWLDSEVKVKKT